MFPTLMNSAIAMQDLLPSLQAETFQESIPDELPMQSLQGAQPGQLNFEWHWAGNWQGEADTLMIKPR